MFDADLDTDEGFAALCRADPEFREPTAQEVAFGQVERIMLTERAQAIGAANQITALATFAAATIARVQAERALEENPPPVEKAWGDGFEQASLEVSLALQIAGPTASARIGEALEITAHFPQVLAALGRGEITLSKVKILQDQTLNLTPEHRAAVADQMLKYGTTKTPGQFRALVRKAVMSIDPEALKRRAKKAVEDRGVWLRELADGMAEITMVLPAGEATGVYAVLDDCARQCRHDQPANEHQEESAVDRDGRTQANRRADAAVDLICGELGEPAAGSRAANSKRGPLWRRRVRVDVRVTVPFSTLFGIDENPAHLTGYGPITADQARDLAANGTWRRILTDPATGNPVDFGSTRYRPSARLRDATLTKFPTCKRPGCTMPAAKCDLDHHQPHHRTGQTTYKGTGPYCRRDHRLKQTPGIHVDHKPDGSAIWTTPSGHKYEYKPEPIADLVVPEPLHTFRPLAEYFADAANAEPDDNDPPPF